MVVCGGLLVCVLSTTLCCARWGKPLANKSIFFYFFFLTRAREKCSSASLLDTTKNSGRRDDANAHRVHTSKQSEEEEKPLQD
jgi:hypothetical protein